MAADLILYNLDTTLAPAGARADIVAISGNCILYLGARAALAELQGPHTRMLDCQGGIVLPGFNDAHCHPIAFAVTQRYLDCAAAGIDSIAEIQTALRSEAAARGGERWIRGANCDGAVLAEGRLPNRWELDLAVPNLPVLLVARDGQHCVLNSRALQRCGIDDNAHGADDDGILRDPTSGLPNGIVSANNPRVTRAIPPLSDDEIDLGLRAANQVYLAQGITSLQDTSWSNGHAQWRNMQLFKERGLLAPRLTMHAGIDALDEFVQRGLRSGAGDEQLRLGAIKLALDESSGNNPPPQAELDRLALRAHRAGFQLAFHVPNLDLLQRSLHALAFVASNAPQRCQRPRFEHCPICPPALLPDLAHSGAIVVSQPNLLWQTGPAYLSQLRADQLRWVFPYRSYVEHGIGLALSSDSPLTPCEPLRAVMTAVSRRVQGGARLGEEEGISLAQALEMHTRAGAYSSNEEHLKGSLAAGQLADLVVVAGRAGEGLADELDNAQVLLTLLDGKLVWTR